MSPPTTPARTTCATSASTASSAPTATDERFEPRPEVDPAADDRRLAAHRRGRRLARRARVDLPRARALGARGAPGRAELERRRDRRRAPLRGDRLAGARGAQGGRRRRRASSPSRRARPSAKRPRGWRGRTRAGRSWRSVPAERCRSRWRTAASRGVRQGVGRISAPIPPQFDPRHGERRGRASPAPFDAAVRGADATIPPVISRLLSRRAEIQMTDDEAAAFLEENRIVVVATNGRDGWPHLVPLWYVVREGELWGWTYAKSGVLGVDEVDPAAGRAPPGLVVEQPQPPLAQRGADRLDVGDPERQLLQPRAGPADELRDGRLRRQRGEQLDAGRRRRRRPASPRGRPAPRWSPRAPRRRRRSRA